MQESNRAGRPTRLAVSVCVAALVASLAGWVAAGAGQPPSASPAWARQVDEVFAAFDRPDSPGCALGVFRDGRPLYERGYGSADLEHDDPITPDSVFYAGSVSKQFTAMAAALAIQEGLFSPDDDVRRFVPELPVYDRPILVRHLVHHTSGLRDINALVAAAGLRDEAAFDNDAVLRVLARQRALNFTPGSEYLYSNSGYAVLALVIERASKTPFPAFADTRIFKPLGMTVTHFHTDLGRLIRNRAYAYDRTASGVRLNTPQNERAGAGGLFTSVRELRLWDENFYTGQVGGRELIAKLETPSRLNGGEANRYAWGLQVAAYRGLPVVEHSGSLGGYRAQVFRIRDAHFSVAILCNVSTANPAELSRRVADICLADRFEEPVPRPLPPAARPAPARPPTPPVRAPEPLADFAGVYTSEELETRYRLSLENGALTVLRGVEKQAAPLRATGPDEFRAGSATLRFSRDARGQVSGFVLDAGRIRGIVFTRLTP